MAVTVEVVDTLSQAMRALAELARKAWEFFRNLARQVLVTAQRVARLIGIVHRLRRDKMSKIHSSYHRKRLRW